MEELKTEIIEVKNDLGYLKYFEVIAYNEELPQPVKVRVHPCEFQTREDYDNEMSKAHNRLYNLAKNLLAEEKERKKQIELFSFMQDTQELNKIKEECHCGQCKR